LNVLRQRLVRHTHPKAAPICTAFSCIAIGMTKRPCEEQAGARKWRRDAAWGWSHAERRQWYAAPVQE